MPQLDSAVRRSSTRTSWPHLGLQALVWTGAASIVVTTTLSARLYRMLGWHAAPIATILVASVTLATMLLRNRPATLRYLRRLSPVLVFATVGALAVVITATRIPYGTDYLLRALPIPACACAAAVLGCAANKRGRFPLAVATASVWLSASAALVDLAQRLGMASAAGSAYVKWSSAVGAFQPDGLGQFRAVGLGVDPNSFGLVGLVALVVAVTFESKIGVRVAIASGAVFVILLSGSRTAAVAGIVACFASLGFLFATHRATQQRLVQLAVVGVAVLVTVGVVGGLMTFAARATSVSDRLQDSTTTLAEGLGGGEIGNAVNTATSERLEIWDRAFHLYMRYPAGAFLLPEPLLGGRSVHNEYLERLIKGGPIMLGAFIYVLAWMLLRLRPEPAPAFGPSLFAAYALAALMLGPSAQGAFMGLGFYLIGWTAAQKVTGATVTSDPQSSPSHSPVQPGGS